MIKRSILLKSFTITNGTWNRLTQRFSDCELSKSGRCIQFEGTENAFNALLDRLHSNESNYKVIGVYEA
jgi:hypothetical protein